MHVHNAASFGQPDKVVSFDAFKVTRNDDHPTYRVEALTPWARSMLFDPRAAGIAISHRAIVLGSPDPRHAGKLPSIQFGYGLGFERRGDALDFLRDVERWVALNRTAS